MKRLHVHISVEDLDKAAQFYSALFGQKPTVAKSDYAKWEVTDPRVNLSISTKCGNAKGINHLGVQAETDTELGELSERLQAAGLSVLDEPGARCCYAKSNKHWAKDPQGVVWEIFQTMGDIAIYGEDLGPDADARHSG